MAAKNSKHPVAVSMREVQARVATAIAAKYEADAIGAYRTLVDIMEHGDVNGERRQAASMILNLAGFGGKQTSITATSQTEERGKMVVEVVHVEKPPATDD